MAETPTKRPATDSDPREPGYRRAGKFLWSMYQQIAAVLAAFGMAAIITDIWDVDWRGVLETAVGFWDSTVRPVTEWLFHYIVTVPLGWFGLEFEVPPWLRNYLAIGSIMALSYVRAFRNYLGADFRRLRIQNRIRDLEAYGPQDAVYWRHNARARRRQHASQVWATLTYGLSPLIVSWPIATARWIFDYRALRRFGVNVVIVFAPLLYLALLVGINFWVMPHIS